MNIISTIQMITSPNTTNTPAPKALISNTENTVNIIAINARIVNNIIILTHSFIIYTVFHAKNNRGLFPLEY